MRVIILMLILGLNIVNAQENKATKLEYISRNFLDYNFEGIDQVYIFDNNRKYIFLYFKRNVNFYKCN